MEAKLIVAEAVSIHPDGTFSLLRGGITHVWGDLAPPRSMVPFKGAVIVRIEADAADRGRHEFDVRCMTQDGATLGPEIKGGFDVPQGGGINNLVLNTSFGFPSHGIYEFVARVDQRVVDRWKLHVQPRPTSKPEA